jgi:circadian clock protein KaiB
LVFYIQLFVSGDGPESRRAIHRVQDLYSRMPAGFCELRIVDVLRDSESAEQEGILATPTLVLRSSSSTVRVVGDYQASELLFRILPTSDCIM